MARAAGVKKSNDTMVQLCYERCPALWLCVLSPLHCQEDSIGLVYGSSKCRDSPILFKYLLDSMRNCREANS